MFNLFHVPRSRVILPLICYLHRNTEKLPEYGVPPVWRGSMRPQGIRSMPPHDTQADGTSDYSTPPMSCPKIFLLNPVVSNEIEYNVSYIVSIVIAINEMVQWVRHLLSTQLSINPNTTCFPEHGQK